MSTFTTRIELYGNPSFDVYDKLHKEMEARKFSRTITTTGGKKLALPSAEYSLFGTFLINEVTKLAKEAASIVWNDFGILVTQTEATRDWHNLKEPK